jgi:CheY-like chemotaxis protein
MENKTVPRFIVIDDDPINNHICSKYIQIVFPGSDIKTFTDPQEGLDHISSAYTASSPNETILFLDINMPVLSGWDVLDRFAHFSDAVKKQFKIFILSSSVAITDKEKANKNPLVTGFIEKPLTIPQLQGLFSN